MATDKRCQGTVPGLISHRLAMHNAATHPIRSYLTVAGHQPSDCTDVPEPMNSGICPNLAMASGVGAGQEAGLFFLACGDLAKDRGLQVDEIFPEIRSEPTRSRSFSVQGPPSPPPLRCRRGLGVEGIRSVLLGLAADVLEQAVDHRTFGDHRDRLHFGPGGDHQATGPRRPL